MARCEGVRAQMTGPVSVGQLTYFGHRDAGATDVLGRMRTTLLVLALSMFTTTSALADDSASAPAGHERLGYQLESGVASTYVFRGRPQYADRKDASSQSTAALTLKHAGPGELSVNMWNATALTTAHAQPGTATEIDLTASYAYTFADKVATSAGYIAYLYPNHLAAQHVDGAHELFGTAALPNAIVTPSVGVYGEVARLRGAYTTAGLSHVFAVRTLTFTPTASLGMAAYDGNPAHLNDVSAMLTSQWNFAEPAYVNLRVAYSYMGGRAADVPGQNGSLSGRSAPWVMLAFGIAR